MKPKRNLLETIERRLLLAAPPMFDAARYEFAGAYPQSVATGDFNEDGFADIATTFIGGTSSGGIRVMINDGAGGFAQSIAIDATYPERLHIADFDEDGHLDLLAEKSSSASGSALSTLLWGRGDGTFESGVTVFPDRSQLAVGDLDGNGAPDIVMSGTTTQPLSIVYGNATRTFASSIGVGNVGATSLPVLGDFNGDSHQDIAVSGTTYLNDANGGFAIVSSTGLPISFPYVDVGDLNGDGFDDVVSPEAISPLLGMRISLSNGNGTFSSSIVSPSPAQGFTPHDFAIVDFNADGKLDIAAGVLYEHHFALWNGNGDGTFQLSQTFSVGKMHYSWTIAADDFNNDGRPDLAMSQQTLREPSGSVSVVLNLPSGELGYAQPFADGVARQTLSVFVNHDDFADLLFVASNSRIGNSLGTQPGVFDAPTFITLPGAASFIASSEFNGDGHVDFAVVGTNFNTIYLGDGEGTFTAVPLTGFSSTRIAVGDFNEDGIDDPAFLGSSVRIATYSGENAFALTTIAHAGSTANRIVAGDVHGDGKTDLVLGGGGTVYRVLRRTDPLVFASPNVLAMPAGFDIGELAVDDLNLDGRADLFASLSATSGSTTPQLRIFVGQGDGTLQPLGAPIAGVGGALATGDFDGDGRIDLAYPYTYVVTGVGTGRVAIQRGLDDGSFAPRESFGLNDVAGFIHAADLDLDGRLDLIATSNAVFVPGSPPRSNSILLNRLGPDTSPLTVRSASIDVESARRVTLILDEPVDADTVSAGDLIATNLATGQTFAASSVARSHNRTRLAFDFPLLPDGAYQFALAAGALKDSSGNASLAYAFSDASTFILAGDINRDRSVNFDDLLILAQNYGQSGRTFSQGNIDYSADGLVGFDDLLLLAQRYGNTMIRAVPTTSKMRTSAARELLA